MSEAEEDTLCINPTLRAWVDFVDPVETSRSFGLELDDNEARRRVLDAITRYEAGVGSLHDLVAAAEPSNVDEILEREPQLPSCVLALRVWCARPALGGVMAQIKIDDPRFGTVHTALLWTVEKDGAIDATDLGVSDLSDLVALGVLQYVGEAPAIVQYAPALPDARQLPQLPEAATRVNPSVRLTTDRSTVEIVSPRTGLKYRFAVTERQAAAVSAPEAHPDSRAALRGAEVLVESGGELSWGELGESLDDRGYVVIEQLLSPASCACLNEHAQDLMREGYFIPSDPQIPGGRRDLIHNTPALKSIHAQLDRIVSAIVMESVRASYSILARYRPTAELPRHVDRKQCAWNLSLPIAYTPMPSHSDFWPLWFDLGGKNVPVRLAPGDAVLYSGTTLPHWREPQPASQESVIGFFHFVPMSFKGHLN